MRHGWILWIASVSLLWGAGCSTHKDSPQLSALDSAYKSGVLTKTEYDAKKAALLASVAPAPVAEPAAAPLSTPGVESPVQSAQAAPAPAAPADGHTYRLKLAKAVDAQGFERPMTSASMLVPVDWQTEGGTTWNIKDRCNTIRTVLRASGPDGRAYEIFPSYNWTWADDPRPLQQIAAQQNQMGGPRPCDVAPAMNARDYIQRNLRQIRPNAQLVGFEPAPLLMESLAETARQTEASARQYNLNQRVKYDAIKARIKYELQGKPVEEWISAATVITGTLGPSYNVQTGQMGQAYTYNCVAYMGAQRAPQGQLDASAKFFEMIGSTYRIDPQWQAKVIGNAQAMQQIELKGVRDRSAIVAKSAEDTRNIQRQIYENKNRVDDAISTQRSQTMRGVETYRNPGTGDTVELSNQYGNAWVNNRGEYLLSDQAGFDPNTVFKNNEGWKPLEHVKK